MTQETSDLFLRVWLYCIGLLCLASWVMGVWSAIQAGKYLFAAACVLFPPVGILAGLAT